MYDLAQLAGAMLLSSVGGVGLWTLIGKWIDRRGQQYDGELGRTRADLATEKSAHKECLERLDAVEKRLEVVEHHHSSLLARWIKDAGKRICWVNGRAMATVFGPLGYTRHQVEGRTFEDLLDVEAAREVDRLDRAALANPGKAASSMIQLHHSLPVMMIVKVAGVGHDQELIYEGHAFMTDDIHTIRDRTAERSDEQSGLSLMRLVAKAEQAIAKDDAEQANRSPE